jgi:hypothetical protein
LKYLKDKRLLLICLFLLLIANTAQTQDYVEYTIRGVVLDTAKNEVEFASVYAELYNRGTSADKSGEYELKLKSNKKNVYITFSAVSYKTLKRVVVFEKGKTEYELDVRLTRDPKLIKNIDVDKYSNLSTNNNTVALQTKDLIVSPGGTSVEGAVKTLSGVSSRNELTTQYNVRGGSYDENLCYINGIKIKKYQFIRRGEQEGLSLINPNLVGGIEFNSGGFGPEYGGRMSSVLDIKYKDPMTFNASANISLLNHSFHIEDKFSNQPISYALGYRKKTADYIYSSLDAKGNYNPNQYDFQSIVNYKYNKRLKFGLYFNYSHNEYKFIPTSRVTQFGSISQQMRLRMFFSGSENDLFLYGLAALNMDWRIDDDKFFKSILSYNNVYEEEKYDIISQFYVSEKYQDQAYDNKDVSTTVSHTRNKLNNDIVNFSNKFVYQIRGNSTLKLGADVAYHRFNTRIDEWTKVDSSGVEELYRTIGLAKTKEQYDHINFSTYVNYTNKFKYKSGSQFAFNAGFRTEYNDFNKEFLVLPRLSLFYKPYNIKDVRFKLSTGVYNQSDFYKEARRPDGTYNKDIKSQISYHAVFSFEKLIKLLGRTYEFTSDIYYKYMDDVIRYSIDNLKISYTGENGGIGNSRGVDLRLIGEFSQGAKSWLSLSVMESVVDFYGDERGYLPALSSQLVNLNLLFQDYLKKYPSYKVKLNLNYGTERPVDNPNSTSRELTMPHYFRADIGFMKVIENPFTHISEISFHADILNLFDTRNVASYMWVSDYQKNQYAVPNYLTPRRYNFSIVVKFK